MTGNIQKIQRIHNRDLRHNLLRTEFTLQQAREQIQAQRDADKARLEADAKRRDETQQKGR